jgi:hypothetical protein
MVCGSLSALYGGRNSVVARPVMCSMIRCVAASSSRIRSAETVAEFGWL